MAQITRVELTNAPAATIELFDELDSTNSRMRERFTDHGERFSPFHTIATTSQTAGRGRLDREWSAPPGASLAMSVYLEFDAAAARDSIGWVSLAGGLAVVEAVRTLAPQLADRVRVKWPNDVLIDGLKVCGILGELLGVVDGGRAFACVLGIGVNVALEQDALPTPTSTSLLLSGASVEPDALAAAIVRALATRMVALAAAGGDADAAGLRAELTEVCSTVGARVRITLPGNDLLEGRAVGIGAGGELEIEDADGTRLVNVGDVEHVRPLEGGWTQ